MSSDEVVKYVFNRVQYSNPSFLLISVSFLSVNKKIEYGGYTNFDIFRQNINVNRWIG